MEQIERYIFSIKELNTYLELKENIVIYGAGDYGKKLVDYIFSQKKDKKIKGIVVTKKKETDCEYKGKKIYEAHTFLQNIECFVMVAASIVYQDEIVEIVSQYGRRYCYITHELYLDLKNKLDSRVVVPYTGIDFLCPGFPKCGTSSLYSALRQIEGIYLSQCKENHFFRWCEDVENPEQKLINNYLSNIREGQAVGIIDPTYIREAKRIYCLFGNKIRILFLVRNPVDAAFSFFKMAVRLGQGELEQAYQERGKFNVEMFDEFLEKNIDNYEYIYWIEQFKKYYESERIKVVFFEELIEMPQVVINDILKFIDVPDQYKYAKLPIENEGNFVMADVKGYKLANLRHSEFNRINKELLSIEDNRNRYEKQQELSKIKEEYDLAEKIYGVKMTKEQRKKAERCFNDSVRKLEATLKKDLTEIWF
ncbi:MAG: sulfotransferase domain-containing protein [Lachnospiraceae bacterium]|nr:sulfotransferase domain-containing protein [Lachnospiraceae bacterium]